MAVYTLIFEFEVATYLNQVEADDEHAALIAWAKELDICEIDGFPLESADALLDSIQQQAPSPVSKLVNVWSLSFVIGHDLAILHLVKTDMLPDS